MRRTWSLFCRVVDNFGDMGVCWRLASQLWHEHGLSVELWVDDIHAMRRFVAAVDAHQPGVASGAGCITLHHWQEHDAAVPAVLCAAAERSEVVIEAFGCGLPDAVMQAMAGMTRPPVWVNLEYLSAEPWVDDCHGLISPLTLTCAASGRQRTLRRHFFFPGFTAKTGGLLRERQLLERHAAWRATPRLDALRQLGLSAPDMAIATTFLQRWPQAALVSVFCYPTEAWASWCRALAAGEPTLCLLSSALPPEMLHHAQTAGVNAVHVPFLSQPDYDRLLGLCDLNIVRGEDSFVRAQWAGRPLVWHIYPQHDGVHLEKLQAFLGLYAGAAKDDAMTALTAFTQAWNSGADCQKTWHYLRPQLPQLQPQARNWQLYLAGMPDLATLLVSYCGEVRSSSET